MIPHTRIGWIRTCGRWLFGGWKPLMVACLIHSLMADTEPAVPRLLNYAIVVTGGEMLEGIYADRHTQFLTRTLHPLGWHCIGATIVDDDPPSIKAALAIATNRVSLVIVTGGLGPTPNDVTRESLAEFSGISLAENPDVIADMEKRFGQTREALRPNLRKQALVPTRGTHLRNANGTAVGLVFDLAGITVVALPGPPRELQPMVTQELVPFLSRRFGTLPLGRSLTLRFVGAGQSLIDQTIKDRIKLPPQTHITSLFEGSRVDFTFSLPGTSAQEQEHLAELGKEVRKVLSEYVYGEGDTTLEEAIVSRLAEQGATLALAEAGSQGGLGAALGAAPGANRVLRRLYASPNESELGLMLGASVAETPGSEHTPQKRAVALAEGCRSAAKSTWGVGIGSAVPEGETRRVWIAIVRPGKTPEVQSLTTRDAGEIARPGFSTSLLTLLWRQLQ